MQVQGSASFESGVSVRGLADMHALQATNAEIGTLQVRDLKMLSDAHCKTDIERSAQV